MAQNQLLKGQHMQTFTLEEAAEILKMHKETLRAKAASGEIPARKGGKRWVFSAAKLEEWLGGGHNPSPQALRVIDGGLFNKPQEEKNAHLQKMAKPTGSTFTVQRASGYNTAE